MQSRWREKKLLEMYQREIKSKFIPFCLTFQTRRKINQLQTVHDLSCIVGQCVVKQTATVRHISVFFFVFVLFVCFLVLLISSN